MTIEADKEMYCVDMATLCKHPDSNEKKTEQIKPARIIREIIPIFCSFVIVDFMLLTKLFTF